jgi:transcriptional regulator with XRE-family HTH domain
MNDRAVRKRTDLTIRTSEAIARNLTAVLKVAGGDAYQSESLPVARLHAETGIAKSTLFKLASKESARACGNPDLETLCRLAEALKIPPGLLLMNQDEWRALIGALAGLSMAVQSPQLQALAGKTSPAEMAEVGLKLAEALTLYPESVPKLADSESLEYRTLERKAADRNEGMRRAILSTTALMQEQARDQKTLEFCTAIGAMMGAAFKPN